MQAQNPSALKSLLILMAVALGAVLTLVASADVMCSVDIERRLPIYPGAEVITTDYNFVRPRAMGVTRMHFRIADDAETVRQWYRDHTLALLDADAFSGLALVERQVNETDEGTELILYSECG